jgi:hypothetical protein
LDSFFTPDPSDGCSSVHCKVESLPKCPITSEFDELLEILDLDKMLIQLLIALVNALVVRVVTLDDPW